MDLYMLYYVDTPYESRPFLTEEDARAIARHAAGIRKWSGETGRFEHPYVLEHFAIIKYHATEVDQISL